MIKPDMVLGFSGFGQVGDPHIIPAEIAKQGTAKNLTVITGASVGPHLDGDLTEEQWLKIKKFCINEVEAREKDMSRLEMTENPEVRDVPIYDGFRAWTEEQLRDFHARMGLAMSLEDLQFIRQYFADDEKRDPSDTEIRLLDTYWSDHCRHTTFTTAIDSVTFDAGAEVVERAFKNFLGTRNWELGTRKNS